MYAIHLDLPPGEFGQARIDLDDLARVVPQVSRCQVEHVYRTVFYVSAGSAPEAGTGVLAAVQHLLLSPRPGGRVRAELRVPREGRDIGLCHGVVSVVEDAGAPLWGCRGDRSA